MKNKDKKQIFFQQAKKASMNHNTIHWQSLPLTSTQRKALNHILHMKIIRMLMLGSAFAFLAITLTRFQSIQITKEKLIIILLIVMSVAFFLYAIYLLIFIRIRSYTKGFTGKVSNIFFLKNEGKRSYYITMVMDDGQVLAKVRVPYQYRNVEMNDEMILVRITKYDQICMPKNVNG